MKQNAESFGEDLAAWYHRHARNLPWRKTCDPYAILVSEMMLQQTQVITVLDYYKRWMLRFPDVPTLASAPESDVLAQWQGLGYYSRARNLQRAAQCVAENHGGRFPCDPETLQLLPGVGKYTAHAVACFAFGKGVPVVDANVARVLSRIRNYQQPVDTAEGTAFLWKTAAELLHTEDAVTHNNALMELGATICTPVAPRCLLCPVQKHCHAREPEKLPLKRPRAAVTQRSESVAWMRDGDRILLRQSEGPVWKGLWHLPVLKARPEGAPVLVSHVYSITRYRVRLDVFESDIAVSDGEWITIDALGSRAIPSPHRVVIAKCLERAGLSSG